VTARTDKQTEVAGWSYNLSTQPLHIVGNAVSVNALKGVCSEMGRKCKPFGA